MTLKQLVYISRAIKLMKSDELISLLQQARMRNKSHNVTGMLLYKDRSFIQLLEGPESAVDSIFNSILDDTRHINIKTIIDIPVTERSFSQWSMGFHNLEDDPTDLADAYTNFMSATKNQSEVNVSTKATILLNYFKVTS